MVVVSQGGRVVVAFNVWLRGLARHSGAKASLKREAWPSRYEIDQGVDPRRDANDNSSTTLIPFKLSSTENYRIWASAMKLALQARNKGLVYSENAANVWKELESTYDKVDESVIFNLLSKTNNVKQGGTLVADYYHRLNSLWREFDALTKLPKCVCEVKCSCDASKRYVYKRSSTHFKLGSTRGIPKTSSATELKMRATCFAAKSANNSKEVYKNNNNGTRCINVKIKSLLDAVGIIVAQVYVNTAHLEMFNEDMGDHIAKVLEILDSIKILSVDSHRLRMKVIPLPLVDDSKQWWISEGDGKITTWEELVEGFFCKFY
nr:hypothetical protein [Tanacetum cinerariifolium]